MLAAFKLRAVPINVNYRYVADELRYLCADADLKAIVHDAEFGERLGAIRGQLPDARPRPVGRRWGRLRGGARRRRHPSRAEVAALGRRPLHRLHGRHHRHAEGRRVAPGGRLLRLLRRRRLDADRTRSPSPPQILDRIQRRPRSSFFADRPAHARRRAVDGVVDVPGRGQERCSPRRGRAPTTPRCGGSSPTTGERRHDHRRRRRPTPDRRVQGQRATGYDASSLFSFGSGAVAVLRGGQGRAGRAVPERASSTTATGRRRPAPRPAASAAGGSTSYDDETTVHRPRGHGGGRPAGSGATGRVARRGHIPLGYHNDPEKTAETFVEVDGRALGAHRRRGHRARRRLDPAVRPRVDVHQHRRREGLPRGGRGRDRRPPRRLRRARRRRRRSPVGPKVAAVVAPVAGVDAHGRGRSRPTAARSSPATRCRGSGPSSTHVQRSPSGKADYAWAKQEAAS